MSEGKASHKRNLRFVQACAREEREREREQLSTQRCTLDAEDS